MILTVSVQYVLFKRHGRAAVVNCVSVVVIIDDVVTRVGRTTQRSRDLVLSGRHTVADLRDTSCRQQSVSQSDYCGERSSERASSMYDRHGRCHRPAAGCPLCSSPARHSLPPEERSADITREPRVAPVCSGSQQRNAAAAAAVSNFERFTVRLSARSRVNLSLSTPACLPVQRYNHLPDRTSV